MCFGDRWYVFSSAEKVYNVAGVLLSEWCRFRVVSYILTTETHNGTLLFCLLTLVLPFGWLSKSHTFLFPYGHEAAKKNRDSELGRSPSFKYCCDKATRDQV